MKSQPFAPAMSGPMLGPGRIAMHGGLPNGQRFLMNPPRLWAVVDTAATIDGTDLGPVRPLRVQNHLDDYRVP